MTSNDQSDLRKLIKEIEGLGGSASDQFWGNYLVSRRIGTEIDRKTATAAATARQELIAATGPDSAIVQSIAALSEKIDENAAKIDANTVKISEISAAVDKLALLYTVTAQDYGAVGDGVADDRIAISNALLSEGTVMLPAGVYRLNTSLTVQSGCRLIFAPGARISMASGTYVYIRNGAHIEATQADQIIEFTNGSCHLRVESGFGFRPEWFGVNTSNSATVNTANWTKTCQAIARSDERGDRTFYFGSGDYRFTAPFFWPQRFACLGMGNQKTRFQMEGSNQHGVECVGIGVDGTIQRDTQNGGSGISVSLVYMKFCGIEVNCNSLTFSGNKKRACMYAAGLSSSYIQENRFGSPTDPSNQMDGILCIPTLGDDDGPIHAAFNLSVVSYNRVRNCRDGIVLGRYNGGSPAGSEPAGGGSGSKVGGDCYENEVFKNSISCGQVTNPAALARAGIVENYYNTSGSTVSGARPKPYANNIIGNSLDMGQGSIKFTGTISLENGSDKLKGVGCAMLSEMPRAGAGNSHVAVHFNDGQNTHVLEILSVEHQNGATLKAIYTGATVNNIKMNGRTGVAIQLDSEEGGGMVLGNHMDQWVYQIRLGNLGDGSRGRTIAGNHHGGGCLKGLHDQTTGGDHVILDPGSNTGDDDYFLINGGVIQTA